MNVRTLAWLEDAREHFEAKNDEQARIVANAAECVRFVRALDAREIAQVIIRRNVTGSRAMLWRHDDRCFDAPDALTAYRRATTTEGATDE